MELTKEFFEKTLLSTEKRIITHLAEKIEQSQEELALMVQAGFEDVMERLDVRDRVEKLEKDMSKIKSALHLSA